MPVDYLYDQNRLIQMAALAATGLLLGYQLFWQSVPRWMVWSYVGWIGLLALRFILLGPVYSFNELIIQFLLLGFVFYHGRWTNLKVFDVSHALLLVFFLPNLLFFGLALTDGTAIAYEANWQLAPYNKRIFDSIFLVGFFLLDHYRVQCEPGLVRKSLASIMLILIMALLLDSGRSALLGVSVGVLVVGWLERSGWRTSRNALWLWGLLAGLVYVRGYQWLHPAYELVPHVDSSGRSLIWFQAINQWMESPVWGHEMRDAHGGLTYWQVYHPHNLPMQLVAEHGVIGLGLLLAWGILFVHLATHLRKRVPVLAGGLVAIGVDSLFSGIWVYPDTQIWIAWYLAFALAHVRHNAVLIGHTDQIQVQQCLIPHSSRFSGSLLAVGLILASIGLLFQHGQDFSCHGCTSVESGYSAPRFWANGHPLHLHHPSPSQMAK